VKKWKLLAYYLDDLRVPLVVRAPQVGNPWVRSCFKFGYLWLFLCEIWLQNFMKYG